MSTKIEIKLPCRTSGHFFPEIVCKDGFMMSVQAGKSWYSYPKDTAPALDLYSHVEVGYPSMKDELLEPYLDCEGSPVYGYVPLEVVREIIRKHGGTM